MSRGSISLSLVVDHFYYLHCTPQALRVPFPTPSRGIQSHIAGRNGPEPQIFSRFADCKVSTSVDLFGERVSTRMHHALTLFSNA